MCLRGNLEIESVIDQYVAQMLENPHVEGSKGLQARFKVVEMGHYQHRHEVMLLREIDVGQSETHVTINIPWPTPMYIIKHLLGFW